MIFDPRDPAPASLKEERHMKQYTVDIGGIAHTVQLDDDEAARLGLKSDEKKAAPEPKNKARKPANKEV